MPSKTLKPIGGYAGLVRSRLRAALPLGFLSFFGLLIYFLLSSINPKPTNPAIQSTYKSQLSQNRSDEVGRFRAPNHSQLADQTVKSDGPNVTELMNDPKKLMSLPILHRTFKDPFDPRSGYKPIPDSKTPWKGTGPEALKSINLLSRSRFPPPGANDAHRGSSPPPLPLWPPRSLLRGRENHSKKPTSANLVHGVNTSYVWSDRSLVEKGNLPMVQWPGFQKPNWESESDRKIRLERQGWVRRGFQHAWEGYKAKAWGHDELRPISGSFADPFGGWGATLVDSLDVLLIMNLTREYNYARTHVRAIDWAHTFEIRQNSINETTISVFETVIRYLGGLISAYDLSGDTLMLKRAEELAEWLLPAFGTPSGLPLTRYRMGTDPAGQQTTLFCLAEIGSMTLEFTRLVQLTSKDFYYDVVQKITDLLNKPDWSSSSRLGTLFPTHVDPRFPQSLSGRYSFGAMADSYYEYLIKEYQLLRGTKPQYSEMFASAIDSARTHLVQTYEIESTGGKEITVIGDVLWGGFQSALSHLACFSGAMIGLGAKLLDRKQDMDLALNHTDACAWSYESTKTGLGPEHAYIVPADEEQQWQAVLHEGMAFRELKPVQVIGAHIDNGHYLGRPETIESVFYMWRITGDRQWQDRGWRMFTSWVESCITPLGFTDLNDVNTWPPDQSDKQESFVLGETLKYYYLLFSEPNLISLDDFVFNTEAHPLRHGTQGNPFKTSWTGPDKNIDEIYNPPSIKEDDTGFGTFVQQWSKVNPAGISDANLQTYKNVLGLND